MSNDIHPILAREGWWHLALSFGVAVLVTIYAGPLWAIPFWLFFVFVLQFFRDPKREIPQDKHAVVSPADGKIVSVVACNDPYLNRPAQKISVFMNVFSVHSNRSPVSGKVENVEYHRGSFVNAVLDKASSENERNAIILQTEDNQRVVSVQIAGLIARRILCYARKNDALKRGQRYGFIRFGSRVDVYLPENANIDVRLGEWVSAGQDIIARLILDNDSIANQR